MSAAHRVTFSVGEGTARVTMQPCPHAATDPTRPCWPHDDTGTPMPAPQADCTYESWIDAVGLECFTEATFDAPIVVASFSDDGPLFNAIVPDPATWTALSRQ